MRKKVKTKFKFISKKAEREWKELSKQKYSSEDLKIVQIWAEDIFCVMKKEEVSLDEYLVNLSNDKNLSTYDFHLVMKILSKFWKYGKPIKKWYEAQFKPMILLNI